MMKVLQINTTLTSGSTGRLASGIGDFMMKHGHQSYIAYSRKSSETESHEIKIGNKIDFYLHVLKTRLGDRHGFGSKSSTEGLVEKINLISKDQLIEIYEFINDISKMLNVLIYKLNKKGNKIEIK